MHKPVKIALIIVGLIIIFLPSVIILALARQTAKLEQSYDNPVIDSKYQNWEALDLDENIRIKLPRHWELETDRELIFIKDGSGSRIAVGLKLPDTSTENMNTFSRKVFDNMPENLQVKQASGYIYGNMTKIWVSAYDFEERGIEEFVFVKLPYYHYYTYCFCFFSDSQGNLPVDEVEAIAYSMAYRTGDGVRPLKKSW